MATNKRVAGLDIPASVSGDTRAFFEAVKQRLEVHTGDARAPTQRAVTIQDLVDAGIAKSATKSGYATITAAPSSTSASGTAGAADADVLDNWNSILQIQRQQLVPTDQQLLIYDARSASYRRTQLSEVMSLAADPLNIADVEPVFTILNTDPDIVSEDDSDWQITYGSTQYLFQAVKADETTKDIVVVNRASGVIQSIVFGNATDATPVEVQAGTAAAPTLTFATDPNTGLYSVGADDLGFTVGGTLRLDISTALAKFTVATQHTTLEIGAATDTTLSRSAAGLLAVEGNIIPHVAYAPTWTGVHTFNNDVNMLTHLHLGTEEIMVVNGATIHGQLEINSDTASIQEVHTHSDTNNSVVYFARSRGTNAAPTIVQSDDYLGVLYGVGYDGTDYALGAGIGFMVDGAPGANAMPTRINFLTSPSGSQTPVNRLSVRAAGNVTISAPDSGIALGVISVGASGTALAITGAGSTTLATLTDATQAVWRAVSGTVTADFMTTTTSAYVRATSNHPLSLRTNNLDRITMAAAGNVTIAAPSSGVQLALANYTGAPSLQWGSSGTLMSMGVYNAAAVSDLSSYIFTTDGVASGIYPSSGGNVVIQARSSAARSIALVTGTTAPAIQLEISTTAITSLLPHLNAAGTVGAPAFSFSGDPNTGLYSVGADQFGIAVGGSAVVTVTTAGLNLVDASASGGFLSVSAGNTTTADFRMAQGGVNRWIFRKTGTAESGANVGSDFVIIRRADDGSQIANALTIARSTGNWSLGDATANPTFTFLGTGALTAGGVFLGPAGAVGAPTFSFSGDPNTGIYSIGADQLGFATAGTLRLAIETDGRIYGKALHNNAGAVTGATNQYIASGTYTPTLSNTTNVAASTPRLCQWMRVGNIVTVSGQLDVDVTAAAATLIGISLPIASALTTAFQLGGVGAAPLTNMEAAAIDGDATNDRAQMRWVAVNTANHTMAFTFQYEVL